MAIFVGQFSRSATASASCILLYTYFLTTYSSVIRSGVSATVDVKINDDDKISDWLDQKNDDFSPIQFTEVSAEKMIRFYKKFNWLRLKHQQDRMKSNHLQLFERGRTLFSGKSLEENNYSTVMEQEVLAPPLLFPDNDRKTNHKGNKIF